MVIKNSQHWIVMDSFFKETGLVHQHLDSFNDFVTTRIQEIINEVKTIKPDIHSRVALAKPRIEETYLEFGKIKVKSPSIREADGSKKSAFPNEARLRDLTYSSSIFLEIIRVTKDIKTGIIEKDDPEEVYIGDLPIMLKSKKCLLYELSSEQLVKRSEDPNDPGGYFVINGTERVLVTQEDLAPNRVIVEEASKSSTSTHVAKVFSTSKGFRAPVTLERKKDGGLYVQFPSVPGKIPLAILMRALGVNSDRDIAKLISSDPIIHRELIPTLEQAATLYFPKDKKTTLSETLDYIGRRVAVGQAQSYRVLRAQQILDKYLLPHIGRVGEARKRKTLFLGQMAQKLLQLVVGYRKADDKDYYANKRLKLAGDLLASLFRVAFLNLCRDIKYQLERSAIRGRKQNVKTAVRADVITERLRHALATGNWVGGKAGVSQLLDRTNFLSSLSHLRRVVSPLSRSQPHFEARDLHPTQWGRLCPNETPEGPNCVLPETRVSIPGGSTYQIKDLEKDNLWRSTKLISIDTQNNIKKPSIISSHIARFVKNKAQGRSFKLYKITTETGRSITTTSDHPFHTDHGIIEAKYLTNEMKVMVLPTALERPNWGINRSNNEIILTEEDIIKASPMFSNIEYHLNFLKGLDLLPLKRSDPRFKILLRLLGFIYGDGHLSYSIKNYSGYPRSSTEVLFTGQIEDLKEVRSDLALLGFKSSSIKTFSTSSKLPNSTITGKTSQTRCYQKPLWILLNALGAPIKDKQTIKFNIPEWLKNAPLPETREFLSALFGCELLKPLIDKRTGKNFIAPTLKMSKESSIIGSLIAFFEDIKLMTEKFDISFPKKYITFKEFFTRKSGIITKEIQLNFSASVDNLRKLWGNIGYSYNKKREALAQQAYSYLKYIIKYRDTRREIAKFVMNKQNKIKGTSIEKARILYEELSSNGKEKFVNLHDLTNWMKTKVNPNNVRVSEKNTLTFDKWKKIHTINPKGNSGLVWEKIKNNELLLSSPSEIVEDVTMSDVNHNFIANGFLTMNCGLVKNLALMAYISVGADENQAEAEIYKLGVKPYDYESRIGSSDTTSISDGVPVYLNGRVVGFLDNAKLGQEFITAFRNKRRNGRINPEVNVTFYNQEYYSEIQINSDPGRVRRPVIIVEKGKSKVKAEHTKKIKSGEWNFGTLLKNGIVEYLDAEEEENSFVAMTEEKLNNDHTHLEIEPATILGICASMIPYPERNQSPRNTYEAGMAKQALGMPIANFKERMDTRSHLLHYPQIPMVQTAPMEEIGFLQRPAGQNFIVAILSYEAYNIEDALIINKASIERGLARSTFFRNYRAEERRYPGGQEDRFEIPDKTVRGYRDSRSYAFLGDDGIVEPATKVQSTDETGKILIGRTSPPRFIEEYREFEVSAQIRRETSVNMRHGEEGTVDSVMLSETIDGNRLVKIRVRDQRIPEIGDKFASRHGQKGILGLIIPQEDMPFTSDGVVPDLIINPHAIPSRMTLGQTFESQGGKAGAIGGQIIDGTAFSGMSRAEIKKILKESGFCPTGREVMYNGMTGKKFPVDIFIGTVYYQKLHHLVKDKLHARARGPVQILTRQPTEGRAREGGLRFGEMERDCLIGHGAALMLKERLLDESDKTSVLICEKCGLLAVYDRNREKYYCPLCGEKVKISRVELSYAFKLLLQELMALCVTPRLTLKEKA
ncbi:MAG: DNA-directed RNA polymerase subunit B [Candidatus Ranarchaeia archaeon]